MDKGERAIAFIQNLKLTKDKWRGQKFKLEPWQKAYVKALYGTLTPDGKRQYKKSLLLVPKKNGKTTLIAGLVLFELFCGIEGGEIYSAANTREQAALIYKIAASMVRADPFLKSVCILRDSKKYIYCQKRNTSYQSISADAGDKNGLDPSLIIYDELCDAPNDELLNILTTAQAARSQPLFIIISTAGWSKHSPLYREYEYAKKVRDGLIIDPTYLPVIYEAQQGDDWKSEETWIKANPNWGVSVNPDFVKEQVDKAKEMPSYLGDVLRYHLNIWTDGRDNWLQPDKWEACAATDIKPEDLLGKPCWAGLDLASTTDIAALVLLFKLENRYVVLSKFWVPRENAEKRQKKDRVPYLTWIRDGYITATDGNVIDYDVIRAEIVELGKLYEIKELAIDRWNATQITTQLQGDGFNVVPFGQGFNSMTAPTKDFEVLVMSQRISYFNNPVFKWMGSNVVVKGDPAGNLKPDKEKCAEKIDGIVACIMALGRALTTPEGNGNEYTGSLVF